LPDVNLLKLKDDQIENTILLINKNLRGLKNDVLTEVKRKRALVIWIEAYFKVNGNTGEPQNSDLLGNRFPQNASNSETNLINE